MGASAGFEGPEFASAIDACLPKPSFGGRDRIKIWPHAQFPFGQALDYERKFDYVDAPRTP
jgi:phenylacetate-CoA ligase